MKVSDLLTEYFENPGPRRILREEMLPSLPIMPKKSEWKREERGLLRDFVFNDRPSLKDFILSVLDLEDEMMHRVKIEIEEDRVSVFYDSRSTEQGRSRDMEFTEYMEEIYGHITGERG